MIPLPLPIRLPKHTLDIFVFDFFSFSLNCDFSFPYKGGAQVRVLDSEQVFSTPAPTLILQMTLKLRAFDVSTCSRNVSNLVGIRARIASNGVVAIAHIWYFPSFFPFQRLYS